MSEAGQAYGTDKQCAGTLFNGERCKDLAQRYYLRTFAKCWVIPVIKSSALILFAANILPLIQ
jgi:hypothetical protein